MSDEHRVVIDRADAGRLHPDDPNLAACTEHDHENHIGDPVDDDPAVAAALAASTGPAAGHEQQAL